MDNASHPLLSRYVIPLLGLLAMVCGSAAMAVDNDYLDALESEATVTSVDSANAPAKSENELRKLEQELQSSYPSTYELYRGLSDADHSLVLAAYRKRHRLSSARSKIIELYVKK
jgi:hypothetical protein